jgi:hypothetical protein
MKDAQVAVVETLQQEGWKFFFAYDVANRRESERRTLVCIRQNFVHISIFPCSIERNHEIDPSRLSRSPMAFITFILIYQKPETSNFFGSNSNFNWIKKPRMSVTLCVFHRQIVRTNLERDTGKNVPGSRHAHLPFSSMPPFIKAFKENCFVLLWCRWSDRNTCRALLIQCSDGYFLFFSYDYHMSHSH